MIGQRIPFGVLHALQSSDQSALLRQLARLDEQEMTVLERTEPPERVHTFRHALIQEVAYQSMLYAPLKTTTGEVYSAPLLQPGTELGWNTLAGLQPVGTAHEAFKYVVFQDLNWTVAQFNPATPRPASPRGTGGRCSCRSLPCSG